MFLRPKGPGDILFIPQVKVLYTHARPTRHPRGHTLGTDGHSAHVVPHDPAHTADPHGHGPVTFTVHTPEARSLSHSWPQPLAHMHTGTRRGEWVNRVTRGRAGPLGHGSNKAVVCLLHPVTASGHRPPATAHPDGAESWARGADRTKPGTHMCALSVVEVPFTQRPPYRLTQKRPSPRPRRVS